MSGGPLLAGASVQRADVAPSLCVLRVREPGETAYVVVAAGRDERGVGLLAARPPRGGAFEATPAGERARLRARLAGARVVGLDELRVVLVRDGEVLVIAPEGAPPRVVLRDAAAGEPTGVFATEAARAELFERGARLVEAFVAADASLRRRGLALALRRGVERLERRAEAVRGDLSRIDRAAAVAARASAFVAAAARAPRGARSLTVDDWSSGEPRPLVLELDPARPAREQLDAMFHRARRLRLGRAVADRRLAEAEAARGALEAFACELDALGDRADAEAVAAMDAIAARAKGAAPREVTLGAPGVPRARGAEPARVPYRAFRGRSGARILVGRGGADNDALTLHVARPHDLWLHAKGRTGAHVVVPLEKGHECPADLLVDAAHLAAHFSDARDEGVVEIEHTPRRYLRKPKGAAPGFVVVGREKVLVLRVERARLAELLASEGA